MWEKSQLKVEQRWLVWGGWGHTCYHYHICGMSDIFIFGEKKDHGQPRYMCIAFIKTWVECTAVVIVICCLGLSERHGFFQLSICSVCQKVLYVFRFSSWMIISPCWEQSVHFMTKYVRQSEKSLAVRKWWRQNCLWPGWRELGGKVEDYKVFWSRSAL